MRRGRIGIAVLIALAAPSLAFILYLIYVSYSPHLLFNPITRYLYPQRAADHGETFNLIPELFSEGEAREQVVAKLRDAGFEPWPVASWDRERGITDTFRIGAGGGPTIGCGIEFFVSIGFDVNGRLLMAENQRDGACL
jgi:hypothetical protein